MNILLINANPVVSRLLILCTRDDTTLLHEVASVEEVQGSDYDVVFVDEASYGRNVAELLGGLKSAKKVFISYRSDAMRGFDMTIKKPFLPSQITEILTDVNPHEEDILEDENIDQGSHAIFPLTTEEELNVAEEIEEEEMPPSVLDVDEIEKIKDLLDMDGMLEDMDIVLSDEERETRKIKVIKEQLISDGLEIVDEDKIVEELSIGLDGTLNSIEKSEERDKKKKVKKSKKKKKAKKLKFTDAMMEDIEDAVEMVMLNMTKKQMKKLLKGKEIEVKIKLEDKE